MWLNASDVTLNDMGKTGTKPQQNTAVLKIRAICHNWVPILYTAAFTMPVRPMTFNRYCLSGFQSSRGALEFTKQDST